MNIDLKVTAEGDEFGQMLKDMYLSSYSCDTQCLVTVAAIETLCAVNNPQSFFHNHSYPLTSHKTFPLTHSHLSLFFHNVYIKKIFSPHFYPLLC